MHRHIEAVFENGVFRPAQPVDLADGQRVSLQIESLSDDAFIDVEDLLDREYIDSCRQRAGQAPSLVEVRRALSAFRGSLAERIVEERDER